MRVWFCFKCFLEGQSRVGECVCVFDRVKGGGTKECVRECVWARGVCENDERSERRNE